MKKFVLLLISFFALTVTVKTQQPSLPGGHSENDRAYLTQEKVFLDTDKNFYLTGETIWYKAYCITSGKDAPEAISSVLYVELMDTRGNALLQEKILLENGQGKGHFFISGEMASDAYILRAYTSWMKNFDPKLFFRQPITILNPFSPTGKEIHVVSDSGSYLTRDSRDNVIVSLPPKNYSGREKVMANISLSAELNRSARANLSVSVYKYSPGLDPYLGTIKDHLNSLVSSPVNANDSQVFSHAYLPEIHGPLIQGTIRPLGSIPVPKYFYILFPGKSSYLYTAEPEDNNTFAIEISPEIRTTDILFWAEEIDMNQFEVSILPEFLPETAAPLLQKTPINEENRPYLESLSVNTQLANAYLPFTNVRGMDAPGNQPVSAFYGSGDIIYNLDEYTRFPTMEEVFTEYIRFVIARKRKDDTQHFYLWDLYANNISISNSIFFDEPALTMIDGVPVGDIETIWNFDPRKIKTIELVNRKYHAGKKIFSGIIYFQTYKGDLAGEALPKDIIKAEYNPVQEIRSFSSPDYDKSEQKNSRIPDYRTLLYWNPEMYTDASGKVSFSFFTGDDTGKYRIEVSGILPDGTPVYGTTDFEVNGDW
ncbi:MAG: hypothetical protein R3D00_00400 [Bacteroidia bacterium]